MSNPNHDPKTGEFTSGPIKLYHSTKSEPRISDNPNRLIPRSISTSTDGNSLRFGPNKYVMGLTSKARIMHVDRSKLDPERHVGQELYDKAKKGRFNVIRLSGNGGPDEYAIMDMKVISKIKKEFKK